MLFNSVAFALFLPIVFALYWLFQRGSLRWQNFLLIVASYVFYGYWDWRFLGLIFVSSLVDFLVGLRLDHETRQGVRRLLLICSLFVNLGLLGFFKYFNFFVDSFAVLLESFGFQANLPTLRLILPVGISFYTFQTLSYTIDLYRKQIQATRDPIAFFAFVSFFPQLVAGPIERAKSLLPQFLERRKFDTDRAKDGMRQMVWGFLKKVVIADNFAPHVEHIFSNHAQMDGVTLLIGVFLFAMQIYCDFSGYSDIAIGTARLFGFSLMRNFAYPYFSRDIAEFWRRWHISLSTWFRDYVFIPLGGSRMSKVMVLRNVIVTFVVSGFWHGANWTFIMWGLINGLYYVPLMLLGKQKRYKDIVAGGKLLPKASEAVAIGITFLLTLLAWVFFRAVSLDHALGYLWRMVSHPIGGMSYQPYLVSVLVAIVFLGVEWVQRAKQHALQIKMLPMGLRWGIYYVTVLIILAFGNFGANEFIYFQF